MAAGPPLGRQRPARLSRPVERRRLRVNSGGPKPVATAGSRDRIRPVRDAVASHALRVGQALSQRCVASRRRCAGLRSGRRRTRPDTGDRRRFRAACAGRYRQDQADGHDRPQLRCTRDSSLSTSPPFEAAAPRHRCANAPVAEVSGRPATLGVGLDPVASGISCSLAQGTE